MTKRNYIILGIILIIVLVLAGAVLVREKSKESVITQPPPIPTPTSETRQPENSPNTQTPKTPEGWKTYENKEFGFAFDYPGDWGVKDVSPGAELRKQGKFNFFKAYIRAPHQKDSSSEVSLEINTHYIASDERGFSGENKIIELPNGIKAYYFDGGLYEDFVVRISADNIIVIFTAWHDGTDLSTKIDIVKTFRLIGKSN